MLSLSCIWNVVAGMTPLFPHENMIYLLWYIVEGNCQCFSTPKVANFTIYSQNSALASHIYLHTMNANSARGGSIRWRAQDTSIAKISLSLRRQPGKSSVMRQPTMTTTTTGRQRSGIWKSQQVHALSKMRAWVYLMCVSVYLL